MLWGNNYVNLIIMIGTSLSDREKFKNVYNQLVEALYDPANVRLLTKCETYEDFLDKIINLIQIICLESTLTLLSKIGYQSNSNGLFINYILTISFDSLST